MQKNLKKNENRIIELMDDIENKKKEIENFKELIKIKDKNIDDLNSKLNIIKINYDALKMDSSRKMIYTEENLKI